MEKLSFLLIFVCFRSIYDKRQKPKFGFASAATFLRPAPLVQVLIPPTI